MKKLKYVLLLLIIASMILVACGTGGAPSEAPAAEEAAPAEEEAAPAEEEAAPVEEEAEEES